VLVWSFALRTDTYLVWQAQAVKDEAIRQKIAALPEARKYQVIAVHDRYDIVDPSWYGNDLVLWWSYALKMVFGDFTRFGIYEHDEKRALSLQRYVAADIDRLLLGGKARKRNVQPADAHRLPLQRHGAQRRGAGPL